MPVGDALDHEWFCERAEAEIARMASVASGAGLSAVVPTCPGWTVARLVKHTGIIHRWATEIVATRAAARIEQRDLDVGLPDSEAGYPSWLAAGAAPLGRRATRGGAGYPGLGVGSGAVVRLVGAADAARDDRAPGGRRTGRRRRS